MKSMKTEKMTQQELATVLVEHVKYVAGKGGKRATLRGDFTRANFRGAKLRKADLHEAEFRAADFAEADLSEVDFRGADLRYTNLLRAILCKADLRGANLDFSSGIPFWCGSFDAIVDRKIMAQMAYHFCRLVCDDEDAKAAQKAIADFANTSHVIDTHDCAPIETEQKGTHI